MSGSWWPPSVSRRPRIVRTKKSTMKTIRPEAVFFVFCLIWGVSPNLQTLLVFHCILQYIGDTTVAAYSQNLNAVAVCVFLNVFHHPLRVSTKSFCIDIYMRLISEQWCTSPSEGIHKVTLYWYLHTIELRTVMHFTIRGYPQSDFVLIFTYDWAPGSDALHPPRVSTKVFCIDIHMRLSAEQWCTSPSEGLPPSVSTKCFCIDIYILFSSEQWCTSPSEDMHKVMLHLYLNTIELWTVMHFTLRGYPQSDFVMIFPLN